jgi:hypothetical protein
MAMSELTRLLVDVEGLSWEQGVKLTSQVRIGTIKMSMNRKVQWKNEAGCRQSEKTLSTVIKEESHFGNTVKLLLQSMHQLDHNIVIPLFRFLPRSRVCLSFGNCVVLDVFFVLAVA